MKSDSTAAGTAVVKDVSYGNVGCIPRREMTNVNGVLFFHKSDSINGAEL